MNDPSNTAAVTAIVAAFQRRDLTLRTLQRIHDCRPCPDEILVHVDCGGDECRAALAHAFPEIRILASDTPVGPGGARNKLIAAARNEIVASFDDDSYPIDLEYFDRLQQLFAAYPEAAIITAGIFIRGQEPGSSSNHLWWVADFTGCGCAYRRRCFLETRGYVPLVVAYGMEEVDIAIQLHARGQKVLEASSLRVFHDTDYSGHGSCRLVSGSIANSALLVYLRYPPSIWFRGAIQVANVVFYAVRQGRWCGIISGLLMIPGWLWTHRHHRQLVSRKALRSFFALRRNPPLLSGSSQ